ncbi:hypothetical protein NP233_g5261 [Leucocoprinus birnbaumii]|uniref:Uncharacterized protein n=1 Tax=Leucocoprinus birnbaumii TaxID=56174 RepID=A0AAD5VWW0_9AGAR|nr:hypothetical protein NP233_g5261 [Leucocoprinus birnbaumii]
MRLVNQLNQHDDLSNGSFSNTHEALLGPCPGGKSTFCCSKENHSVNSTSPPQRRAPGPSDPSSPSWRNVNTRVIIPVVVILAAFLISAALIWRKLIRRRRLRDTLNSAPADEEKKLNPTRENHTLGRKLKKSSRGADKWRNPPAGRTGKNYKEVESRTGPGTHEAMARRLDAIEEEISPASEKKDRYARDMRDLTGQEGGYGWGYGKRDEIVRLQRERSEEQLPTEPAPAYSRHPD